MQLNEGKNQFNSSPATVTIEVKKKKVTKISPSTLYTNCCTNTKKTKNKTDHKKAQFLV